MIRYLSQTAEFFYWGFGFLPGLQLQEEDN